MKKPTLTLIILLSLLLTTTTFAWTAPNNAPPGSDASAPLNVSSTGQVKSGGLIINGTLRAFYNMLVGGSILATTSANLLLDVEGNVGASGYCDKDGNNCKTILELASGTGGGSGGGGAGTYVGATSSGGPHGNGTYNGTEVGGYAGGDAKCNTAFPGSRMSYAGDFVNGLPTSNGWYSVFFASYNPAWNPRDCFGWTRSDGSEAGSVWSVSDNYPATGNCGTANKILCSMPGSSSGGGGSTGGGGGGVYVGATTNSYDGNRGGYAAANSLCQAQVPGSDRVCSSSDFANGLPTSAGWYNGFLWGSASPLTVNDCRGWTSNNGATSVGFHWNSAGVVENQICSGSSKFLCCSSSGGGSTDGSSGSVGGIGDSIFEIKSLQTGTPAACPSGWSDLSGSEFTSDFTPEGNNIRTCYRTDQSCQTITLRAKYPGTPSTCPSGWTTVDAGQEIANGAVSGLPYRNNLRVCYSCGGSGSSSGSSVGNSIMYLAGSDAVPPASCPTSWAQADFKAEGNFVESSSPRLRQVRTCYRSDLKCDTMYLAGSTVVPPASCPASWTEADLKVEGNFVENLSSRIRQVRTCYKCN